MLGLDIRGWRSVQIMRIYDSVYMVVDDILVDECCLGGARKGLRLFRGG